MLTGIGILFAVAPKASEKQPATSWNIVGFK